MKAQISRKSHRPDKRYSGVYHIQGAMVTDADLIERSDITRDRTDNLGNDAIRDGVPEEGGAIGGIAAGKPFLKQGVIYADGVRGVLTAAGKFEPDHALSLITQQADLPHGPTLPEDGEFLVYADIWDRPVHPLEDPYLADPGLHGAVTGFRTRTMVQIKTAPPEAEKDIERGTGAFPTIGTAQLAITDLDPEFRADDCDPCAEVITAEQEVPNALWRLEIVLVEGAADAPSRVAFAWSEENAGIIAPADIEPDLFQRAGKVYEYFSEITECYSGVFANSDDALRTAIADDLGATPSPAKDHDGDDWPFLRRWDGYAEITVGTGTVVRTLGEGTTVTLAGGVLTLETAQFRAELDLKNAAVVRGDYWLVEMRRHAPEGERIRLVQPGPVGIRHHYCTLGVAKGEEFAAMSDALRRKLSLPPLSNLPADHVAFDNNCEKLYGSAENVQQALDNLCMISAEDIAFDPTCPLYGDASTVQEAFDALCNINFSVDGVFRHLFDWGVVCGIVPTLLKRFDSQVRITPGAFLDRRGKLVHFKGAELDLSDLRFGRTILFDGPDDLLAAFRKDEVCLALAEDGNGDVQVFVVPKSLAFGPDDPGFGESVRRCVEKKKVLTLEAIVARLPKERQRVANRIILTLSGKAGLAGRARLTAAEFREQRAFVGDLIDSYAEVAGDDEVAILKERIDAAVSANPVDNLTGAAREVRQMQQATAVLQVFVQTDGERLRRCLCQALFPKCPPALGEGPYMVPIACLDGSWDTPRFFLDQICPWCCRKQALTLRSVQYFIGEMRENLERRLKEACCVLADRQPDKPSRPIMDNVQLQEFTTGNFIEEAKLLDAFLGRPEKLPTDYKTAVAVNGLGVKEAVAALQGTGFEVATTVDVNDAKALDALQENLVGLTPGDLLSAGDRLRPGDRVALMVDQGVARGYVLLEYGSGKLPFDKLTATDASVPFVGLDAAGSAMADLDSQRETLMANIAVLAERLKALQEERQDLDRGVTSATTSIRTLVNTRDRVAGDIEQLNGSLSDMDATRKEAGEDIRQMSRQSALLSESAAALKAQMGDLDKTRQEIERAAESAKENFADSRKAMAEFRRSVRGTLPVGSVLDKPDAEIVAALAQLKIVHVNDAANMTDAQVRNIVRRDLMDERTVRRLIENAKQFIES